LCSDVQAGNLWTSHSSCMWCRDHLQWEKRGFESLLGICWQRVVHKTMWRPPGFCFRGWIPGRLQVCTCAVSVWTI
jgi:hypothetical protein